MKPYAFRLEKILDYRKYLSKRAQIDVFNARNACLKSEKEVLGIVEKKTQISEKCSQEGNKGMRVSVYQIYQTFLQKLDSDLEKAHNRLNEEKENVMSKERNLKQASIKEKTLETLRDLQHKKYLESLGRKEQKLLDEIVLIGKGVNS